MLQRQSFYRAADVGLVALFAALIAAPMTWNALGFRQAAGTAERRPLPPRPQLKPTSESVLLFPVRFEAFYNDHVGLRMTLIHWLDHAEVWWLKSSSAPTVIVGKNGWFFLTEAPCTKGCQPSQPLAPMQLARWKQVLEARRDWLAQRGIRYLVVFVPEKQTVYREHLPRKYRPLQTQDTRLDQLTAYLRMHTDVPVLDLREPLREAKAHDRLYHCTDAHWNARGAYVGYRGIVDRLASWFAGMEPLPRAIFKEDAENEPGGDCARLLGLDQELVEENLKLTPTPEHPLLTRWTTEGFQRGPACIAPPFAMLQTAPHLPRAVMFGDSFTAGMVPFLSQHLQRIAYYSQVFPTFDVAAVEREQPDVVIQEMVERKLQYLDMVEHQLIPVIPPDFIDEPADNICRTARKWSTFLLGEN
jgi:alginate O-acetyltransferase complex protein AlgJ